MQHIAIVFFKTIKLKAKLKMYNQIRLYNTYMQQKSTVAEFLSLLPETFTVQLKGLSSYGSSGML